MPRLSVVVPVFNEEPNLAKVIDFLMESPCAIEREWIFVDDCSTDESLKTLRAMSEKYGFKLLEQPHNMGKGCAVIRGFEAATGDYTMIQDADFEYDPADVPALIEPLLKNQADVVFGSRFKRSVQVHRTYHFMVNRVLTLLSNFFSGIYLTDMETCYKVFRTSVIKEMNLKSKRFGIEVELTAYIAKLRLRIFELPISYFPRQRLHGKKISWRDGIAALWHLFKFNMLVPADVAFKNPERLTKSLQDGYDLPQFDYLKQS